MFDRISKMAWGAGTCVRSVCTRSFRQFGRVFGPNRDKRPYLFYRSRCRFALFRGSIMSLDSSLALVTFRKRINMLESATFSRKTCDKTFSANFEQYMIEQVASICSILLNICYKCALFGDFS